MLSLYLEGSGRRLNVVFLESGENSSQEGSSVFCWEVFSRSLVGGSQGHCSHPSCFLNQGDSLGPPAPWALQPCPQQQFWTFSPCLKPCLWLPTQSPRLLALLAFDSQCCLPTRALTQVTDSSLCSFDPWYPKGTYALTFWLFLLLTPPGSLAH